MCLPWIEHPHQTVLKDLGAILSTLFCKNDHPCRKGNILPNRSCVSSCPICQCVNADDGTDRVFRNGQIISISVKSASKQSLKEHGPAPLPSGTISPFLHQIQTENLLVELAIAAKSQCIFFCRCPLQFGNLMSDQSNLSSI